MRYSIGNKIGDVGGFGSVYVCTSELGDQYAIKLLNNVDSESIERFTKEIRLTMRLSHPNIIKIIAYDTNNHNKYYIMPLYSSSLRSVIPELYGHYDRQYKIISEILNGVIYLHTEGVLHRDLKPENILYNSDSDIVINDLGFCRQIDSDSARLTHTGYGFGTPRYSAPEQFADAKNATEKSDIFSLGKIIEDIVTKMLCYSIPTNEFEYIISKCTYDNPNKRFENVIELKSAVDSVYQQLLGIVDNNTVDELLTKIKLEAAEDADIHNLALRLLNREDSEKIEEFFYNLSNNSFISLEQKDSDIVEKLIIRLQQYLTGQMWGFGYTDTIGKNCSRIYNISHNVIVKANILYTLIDVGISHNRFYVMGIATDLLKKVKSNVAESLELVNLVKDSGIALSGLNIQKDDLQECLQPYF